MNDTIRIKVTVRITSIYGKQSIYPVCPMAKSLAKLLGQKTLTQANILVLKEAGFMFVVEQPEASALIG